MAKLGYYEVYLGKVMIASALSTDEVIARFVPTNNEIVAVHVDENKALDSLESELRSIADSIASLRRRRRK